MCRLKYRNYQTGFLKYPAVGTSEKTQGPERLKVKGYMDKQANNNQKKVDVDVLIPDKRDVKANCIIRNKEGHYII